MRIEDAHLSDQDLLLAADGELPARREAEVRRHLQACWVCRKRMADFEITIFDFVTAYQAVLDPQVPAANGRDAMLRRRLKASHLEALNAGWAVWRWRAAISIALLAMLLAAGTFWKWRLNPTTPFTSKVIPNANLTPGEATSASRGEVCQAQGPANEPRVPEALREAVFSAYGMKDAPRDAYEVDFLITPELGGAASLRNLWPEPYSSPEWNAHIKDRLEKRLRSLVCHGDLDLATAQHEIASNWVNAYKKYVGSDNPI